MPESRITNVDNSYVDTTPSGLSAEVEATLTFRVDFTVMAEIMARGNGEQQADFFNAFAVHMDKACGTRIDFQWGAIAEHLDDGARDVLKGLLHYLSERGKE